MNRNAGGTAGGGRGLELGTREERREELPGLGKNGINKTKRKVRVSIDIYSVKILSRYTTIHQWLAKERLSPECCRRWALVTILDELQLRLIVDC